MTTDLLFVHALTPLHCGIGQGINAVDLPIARERATNVPIVPGSSLRGVLRDATPDGEAKDALFGPTSMAFAGAAVFTDARLVWMPVRSIAGTFALCTSPHLLHRLKRDASAAGLDAPSVPVIASKDAALVTATSPLLEREGCVILEELDLSSSAGADEWAAWIAGRALGGAWADIARERVLMLHDDTMGFLLESATEVVNRVRLEDDSKTVADGALWNEEALPAESLLVALVQCGAARGNLQETWDAARVRGALEPEAPRVVQLGGHAGIGRGLCNLTMGAGAA
jgi:CRISPR-associated protein Cmr4